VLLGHDELDLVLGTDRHVQAAEVDPFLDGVPLRCVPRASLRSWGPRGLRAGRLVVERLVIKLVAELLLVLLLRVPGVVPARVC
jgi:hypothetical protein